ncbi:MAG: hypothetical protein LBU29_02705 [Endomicrobium sp.]|jgi:hypothetical protein|nr:hypothetical protein [Endomicrobium sp.]
MNKIFKIILTCSYVLLHIGAAVGKVKVIKGYDDFYPNNSSIVGLSHGDDHESGIEESLKCYELRNHHKMIHESTQPMELDPENLETFFGRGFSYLKFGKSNDFTFFSLNPFCLTLRRTKNKFIIYFFSCGPLTYLQISSNFT